MQHFFQPEKLPLFIYSIVMIVLYARGFLLPEETSYWLIKYGFPILIMEFFSIFISCFLYNARFPRQSKKNQQSIKFFQQNPNLYALIPVIIIMLMALLFLYFMGTLNVFIIFIVSIVTKFIALLKLKTYEEHNIFLRASALPAVSLFISVFISLAIAWIPKKIFSEQNSILRAAIYEQTPDQVTISGEVVSNPAFIAVWGILNFAILIIMEVVADMYQYRTGKYFVQKRNY